MRHFMPHPLFLFEARRASNGSVSASLRSARNVRPQDAPRPLVDVQILFIEIARRASKGSVSASLRSARNVRPQDAPRPLVDVQILFIEIARRASNGSVSASLRSALRLRRVVHRTTAPSRGRSDRIYPDSPSGFERFGLVPCG